MKLKQDGVIKSVFYGREDHDCLTMVVHVSWDGGVQGFGARLFSSQSLQEDFARDLCTTFTVSHYKYLEGRPCTIYRCFDHWNSDIEAIGPTNSDRKFIIWKWERKHFNEVHAPNPLQRVQAKHLNEAASLRRRLMEVEAQLLQLEAEYTPIE